MNRAIGTEGVLLVVGLAETAMPAGYNCYAMIVRVDGTIIASVTIDGSAVTDLSWEDVALQNGDYIPLETPLTSITLTGAADSVWCYLQTV